MELNLHYTIPLFDDDNNNESLSDDMIINNSEKSEDSKYECTTHFSWSSQTEIQLSTSRLATTNAPNNNEVVAISTYYKHTLPVFEDMMNSCKTKKKFEEVVKMMETQHYRHVRENGILPRNNTARSTYVCWKK